MHPDKRAHILLGIFTPLLMSILASSTRAQQDAPTQLAKAQAMLGRRQFAEAEKILSRLTAANSKNSRVHFLLGYCLQSQKKFDTAKQAYGRVTGPAKRLAEYNTACICAVQGKKEEAIVHLQRSVKAGFKNFAQMAVDPDLAALRSDSRFRALMPARLPDNELFVEPTRILHQFVGESAGGQFGWTARKVGDWDRDGVIDFVATAPTYRDAGRVYVYSSKTGKLLLKKDGQRRERLERLCVANDNVLFRSEYDCS